MPGQHAWRIITAKADYILAHAETVQDGLNSVTKLKTVGKLIDNQVTPEAWVNIVLMAESEVKNNQITKYFRTQSIGSDRTKSPVGMFDLKIPNDLGLVDNAIRDYYGM